MQHLNDNFLFEQGQNPDVLLILFTGFGYRPVSQQFDFLQASSRYPYSRIFVRDPSQRLCLRGIGGQLDSLEKMIDALRTTAHLLKAKKIITVGSSGGSFPAILAAHLLKADYCHAFSPFPYANLERAVQRMDWQVIRRFRKTVVKLNFLPTPTRKYYDLREVLSDTNGHTHFYLHVCKNYRWDYVRAKYLAGLRNVAILAYSCDQHVVVRYLVKKGIMDNLLKIENQDALLEMDVIRNAKESD